MCIPIYKKNLKYDFLGETDEQNYNNKLIFFGVAEFKKSAVHSKSMHYTCRKINIGSSRQIVWQITFICRYVYVVGNFKIRTIEFWYFFHLHKKLHYIILFFLFLFLEKIDIKISIGTTEFFNSWKRAGHLAAGAQ